MKKLLTYLILLIVASGCNEQSEKTIALVENNFVKEYYNNGTLKSKVKYDENKRKHGLYIEYHPNGNMKIECNFNHGLQNGLVIEYYENKMIKITNEWNNGVFIGEQKFYSLEGSLISHITESKNGIYTHVGNIEDSNFMSPYPIIIDNNLNDFFPDIEFEDGNKNFIEDSTIVISIRISNTPPYLVNFKCKGGELSSNYDNMEKRNNFEKQYLNIKPHIGVKLISLIPTLKIGKMKVLKPIELVVVKK
jgi:hypothetical protein